MQSCVPTDYTLPAILPKVVIRLTDVPHPKDIPRERIAARPVLPRSSSLRWLLLIAAILLAAVAGSILFHARRARRSSTESSIEQIQPTDPAPPSMPQLRDQGGAALRTVADLSQLLHSLEGQIEA